MFEFYTAGVGVAAVVGAGFLVLAAYGLAALPTQPLGVILLAVGVIGYAVDVQAGAPRAWTVIGTVALAVGSVRLYDGMAPSPLVMALVVAGVALFMVAGMPSMVRARFSTPTIGRESMIGEVGVAAGRRRPRGDRRGAGRAVAGPHQPGHAHRRRRAPSGSWASTASSSRSSRSGGGP